jgi:hypothetical protein
MKVVAAVVSEANVEVCLRATSAVTSDQMPVPVPVPVPAPAPGLRAQLERTTISKKHNYF